MLTITAIVRPQDPSTTSATSVSPREFRRVDQFVAALGQALGVNIDVIEGALADAPETGLIVVFDSTGLREHPELGPRVVLVNADRSRVPAILEEYKLCAAIEKQRYFRWQTQRDKERGAGLFGRADLAAQIGATMSDAFRTERYGLLNGSAYKDLVELLAAYLRAAAAHSPSSGSPLSN